MECRLKTDTTTRALFQTLGVDQHDVIAIDYEALWLDKKLAPWARDLIFTAGSTGCVQILIADSIPKALKRLAGRGLVEFFSGFTREDHMDRQLHKPTILVRNSRGGPSVKRVQ